MSTTELMISWSNDLAGKHLRVLSSRLDREIDASVGSLPPSKCITMLASGDSIPAPQMRINRISRRSDWKFASEFNHFRVLEKSISEDL